MTTTLMMIMVVVLEQAFQTRQKIYVSVSMCGVAIEKDVSVCTWSERERGGKRHIQTLPIHCE